MKLEQLIRFGTDAAGLERLFRFLQASLHIITAYPLLFNLFLFLLSMISKNASTSTSALPDAPNTRRILLDLRSRFALARRFFRIFRFLENFQAAHALYVSTYSNLPRSAPNPAPTTPPDPAEAAPKPHAHPHSHRHRRHRHLETYLDIFCRSFNGMYLLLESLTLLDVLDVQGFALWGPIYERRLAMEAQRFWFFSLACGIASGVLKLLKVFAYAPVPETGEGYGTGEKGYEDADDEKPEWRREQERLRRIVLMRKEQRVRWRREVKRRSSGLLRRLLADALDLLLPGSVVGWVPASAGTVGLAMLGSTVLTGWEIWERCGREVAMANNN